MEEAADSVANYEGGKGYVRTDVPTDVAVSLELLEEALGRAPLEPSWWKWAWIAAHMAVSTALVGYLTGTAGIGALTEKSTKALMQWYEARHPRPDPPPEKLAEFPVLLKRVAAGQQGFPSNEAIELSPEAAIQLKRLHAIRNGFNHFRDQGWSIEIEYVLPLLGVAVDLIEQIAANGWAFRHADEATRRKIAGHVSGARERLAEFLES